FSSHRLQRSQCNRICNPPSSTAAAAGPLLRVHGSSDSESEASDNGADHDGEDRISRLPDTLLADIIHRLPTKDVGRTAAVSTYWRRVWAGTPLLVDDAHLLGPFSPSPAAEQARAAVPFSRRGPSPSPARGRRPLLLRQSRPAPAAMDWAAGAAAA